MKLSTLETVIVNVHQRHGLLTLWLKPFPNYFVVLVLLVEVDFLLLVVDHGAELV